MAQQPSIDERLPLRNLRVVDFSWVVAGPQATRILADLGADVIRVEYEGRLDSMRLSSEIVDAPRGSVEHSGMFATFNRNKRGVTLNVQHPDGMALLHDLLRVSDVVIENFSARVFAGWGLPYEAMRAINPAIIYVSISGFGHEGRDRGYVTWGPTAQAVSGLTAMSGLPGLPPAGWGFSYLDHTAGFYGALAIQLALYHREQTGADQYIDIAQVETGMALTGPQVLDYAVNGRGYLASGGPPGNRSRTRAVAPHNTYRCVGDDRWVTIVCEDEGQWRAFCRALGDPDWTNDPCFSSGEARYQNQDALDRNIEQWTAVRDPYEVMEALHAAGVPAGVAQNAQDKREHDPQLAARGFYQPSEHAVLGRHDNEGLPVKFSRSTWSIRHAQPLVGEHRAAVYGDLLGRSEAQLAALSAEAAI